MRERQSMKRAKKITAVAMALALCLSMPFLSLASQAGPYGTSLSGQSAARPEIQAEGAVVIDGETGAVLYGKNEKNRFYPASTTKLMTALLTLEKTNLNDTVTFSKSATTNLESGASTLNLTEGDRLSVEQCLYGLLLKSANEIGNALAEHISGSVSGFADLMNQKAAALGCTGTHFANPHGLNNNNHYTTPYDMALIARAAFQNETLRKIDTTTSYQFPATKKSESRTITMGHKMMYPTDSRYYEGIIGGKTGYTSLAGNTLVTGAERNGVRLIAVVMKSKSTHYADTKALLDYGFAVKGQKSGSSSQPGTTGSGTAGTPSGSAQSSQPGTAPSGTAGVPSVSAQSPVSGSAGSVMAGAAPGSGQMSQPSKAPSGTVSGPPGTGSQNSAGSFGPSSGTAVGWMKDTKGWYYIKSDGARAANEWLNINQTEYWIDPDGYMATGWRQFIDDNWYFFKSDGAMAVNGWAMDNGKWFYLGADGAMVVNTRTPDGYQVGSDGAWIP